MKLFSSHWSESTQWHFLAVVPASPKHNKINKWINIVSFVLIKDNVLRYYNSTTSAENEKLLLAAYVLYNGLMGNFDNPTNHKMKLNNEFPLLIMNHVPTLFSMMFHELAMDSSPGMCNSRNQILLLKTRTWPQFAVNCIWTSLQTFAHADVTPIASDLWFART